MSNSEIPVEAVSQETVAIETPKAMDVASAVKEVQEEKTETAQPPAPETAEVPIDSENIKKEVLKQVEFYFSDDNLPRDKFLKGKVQSDPEGYVDISVLLTFSKMRQYAEHYELVVEALRSSKKLLEVNSDGTRVRRLEPINFESFDKDFYFNKQVCLSYFKCNVIEDSLRSDVTDFVLKALSSIPEISSSEDLISLLTRVDLQRVFLNGFPKDKAQIATEPFDKIKIILHFKDAETAIKIHEYFTTNVCSLKDQILTSYKKSSPKATTEKDFTAVYSVENTLKITGYPNSVRHGELLELFKECVPNFVSNYSVYAGGNKLTKEPFSVVVIKSDGKLEEVRDGFNANEEAVIKVICPKAKSIKPESPQTNEVPEEQKPTEAPTDPEASNNEAPEEEKPVEAQTDKETSNEEASDSTTETSYRLQAALLSQDELDNIKSIIQQTRKRSQGKPSKQPFNKRHKNHKSSR